MFRSKHLFSSQLGFGLLFGAILLLGALLLGGAPTAPVYGQTIPTITPIPSATNPPPQATNPPPQPTATTAPPAATNTPVVIVATATSRASSGTATTPAEATATAAAEATADAAATPVPTAERCSDEPTLRVAVATATLYGGPGDEYDEAGELERGDTRLIAGRAAEATWWAFEQANGDLAWIADDDVTVQGDTSELPVLETPALPDGATATPGAPWEPTPAAACVTPTATASATATEAAPTATATPTVTATATEAAATNTPAAVEDEPEAEVAPPLDDEPEGGSLLWLPIGGLLLIGAAAFLYFTRRNG